MKTILTTILSLLLAGHLSAAERIVSLGGAATEIVFALGHGPKVVGVDQSSVYPAAARKLPQAGYVRTISAEGVLALEPTHIIATSALGPRNAVEQLRATGIPLTLVPSPDSPQSLYAAIREIGQSLDQTERAEALIAEVAATLEAVERPEARPGVVFLMRTPGSGLLNAAGQNTKADAVVELAGGDNLIQSHRGYKAISTEALVALQPEVILIGQPEGMPTDSGLPDSPGLSAVPAVRQQRVHTVPLGKTLAFGPRLGQAVRELNERLRQTAP